jgi:hypothetical protein
MYQKNTTTASHRHTEAPCKITSVKRRARSDAPYQSNPSLPIRVIQIPRPVPPPRLRGKNIYSSRLTFSPHSIRLTTRLKRINSPKKINDSMRIKNRHTKQDLPPTAVKPGKGYSSLVKDILMEGGRGAHCPRSAGSVTRSKVGTRCGHRIRVRPRLFTLLPLAFSTVTLRTARGFGAVSRCARPSLTSEKNWRDNRFSCTVGF